MKKTLPIVGLATVLAISPLQSKSKTSRTNTIKQKNQSELVNNFEKQDSINFTNKTHKEIINMSADSLPIDILRQHMLIEINKIRDSLGIGTIPLKLNDKVSECAQEYAEYMYKNNRFDHENKEGESHADRLKKHGFNWKNIVGSAENLGKNQESIYEILNTRLNNPSIPHRKTVLEKRDTDIGIGFYKGFWVLNTIEIRENIIK